MAVHVCELKNVNLVPDFVVVLEEVGLHGGVGVVDVEIRYGAFAIVA